MVHKIVESFVVFGNELLTCTSSKCPEVGCTDSGCPKVCYTGSGCPEVGYTGSDVQKKTFKSHIKLL